MIKEKEKSTGTERFEKEMREACDGLFYMSETDAEIVPFFGGKAAGRSRESLLENLELKDLSTIEERSFDEFFSRLTKIQDWFIPNEIQNAKQFGRLRQILEDNLTDLTVIRIGRIQIDIYIVGIDIAGNLAGVKTNAVET